MTKLKSNDHGSALLVVLLASSLLAALGLSLAGLGSMEATIAANHRAGSQVFYAADGAGEAVLADLLSASNWTDILNGTVTSQLAGQAVPPVGPGDPPVTLAQLTSALQAQSDASGSWGANSPQWRLFAHGWFSELAPGTLPEDDDYLIAWVADDVAEADANPFVDSNHRIQFVARAMNARGMRRGVTMTVEQTPELTPAGIPAVRVLAWRSVQ